MEGVTPDYFWNNGIPEKKSKKKIRIADLDFLPTLGLGSVSSVAVGPLSEEGIGRSLRALRVEG